MKTIILQTLTPVNRILTNSAGRKPCAARRGFLLIPLILVCFALCHQVQSAPDAPKQVQSDTDVVEQVQSAPEAPEQEQSAPDTPDPGPLPATSTGDAHLASSNLTTGAYNS